MSSCIVNARTLIEHDPNAIAAALEITERGAHRVALRFEDPELLAAALLGAFAAGAIAIPIDRRLHPDEVARMLAHSSADLLLWDAADPRLSSPCPTAGRECFLRTGSPPDRSGALLLYTSGSTARPKGVLLDAGALLANASAWNARYALGAGDVVLCTLSLAHSFGITAGILASRLANARMIAVPPARLSSAAARERPTIVLAVSPIYAQLARTAHARDLATVRAFLSGAAPLPAAAIEAFAERVGRPVVQTYGLTEAGPVVTANPIDDNRIGTVGTALAGVELALAEDKELLVRSPALMSGYLDDAGATARAISGGWLRTGDLGELDAGYLRISGRKKDLIIRGGEKIHPQEIEEVLLAHPSVRDAAVVGASRDGGDETVVACVVLDPSASLERADLGSFCARSLAAFKIPREFRAFAELPRNPNGKLLRAELRRWVDADRGVGS